MGHLEVLEQLHGRRLDGVWAWMILVRTLFVPARSKHKFWAGDMVEIDEN